MAKGRQPAADAPAPAETYAEARDASGAPRPPCVARVRIHHRVADERTGASVTFVLEPGDGIPDEFLPAMAASGLVAGVHYDPAE
jgi:hypothetical protein